MVGNYVLNFKSTSCPNRNKCDPVVDFNDHWYANGTQTCIELDFPADNGKSPPSTSLFSTRMQEEKHGDTKLTRTHPSRRRRLPRRLQNIRLQRRRNRRLQLALRRPLRANPAQRPRLRPGSMRRPRHAAPKGQPLGQPVGG